MLPDKKELASIEALIKANVLNSTEEQAKGILDDILKQSGFSLVDTFCDSATDAQAFLCTRPSQKIAVLAFRGTEPNLKDIKADIKGRLIEVPHYGEGEKVQIHSGYFGQFEALRDDIVKSLSKDELEGFQLFITGHSLGGALAIVAVKFLADDITGACYTFGSPPVGTKAFDRDIKTPIYRIVNHVDIVPRLPNPIMVQGVRLLAIALEIVLTPFAAWISHIKESAWYDSVSRLLFDAQKYRQSGYGSFLVGEGNDVRLRYSVGIHDRLWWWIKQFRNLFHGDFKLLSDHSIDTYADKLAKWALQRK